MTTGTQRIADDSTFVGLARALVARLRMWVATSRFASAGSTFADMLATATDSSVVVQRLIRWIHHSYLYRWVTKEPDPDVVVIDLRGTYTVGPFVVFLNRLTPALGRAWRGSRLYRLAGTIQTISNHPAIAESRVVQLLVAVFEPPKPPEEIPDEDRRN